MLMNVVDPGEIRVALVGDNGLEELYIERTGGEYVHGNIFKGKVQNIEPSLQAAFVDIGSEKNGFLHVSDVVPPHGGFPDVLKKRRRKKVPDSRRPRIEEMLHKGQELLVQITREQIASKGPSLTTYVSLPGRYLVLMPAVNKRGVSRKIVDDKQREELKKALNQIDPPKDMGFIIRTAGMGRGREELQRDLDYLTRLWEAVLQRTTKVKPPAPIYRESDLVIRAIRDYVYDDVIEVLIDREAECDRAREFLHAVMPNFEKCAKLYTDSDPLFHHFGIEEELDRIFARSVRLKSGGEIVIEQTEAMVTIDVNTGSYRGADSREVILDINLEAAAEVARQLRLRDMGGLIVIDYIDMDHVEDRRKVEETFREAMRRDRARHTILPISSLGLMELTRQRMRKSLFGTLYSVCPSCGGTGVRKKPEALGIEFIREARARLENGHGRLIARLHPEMALSIGNAQRQTIAALEQEKESRIELVADAKLELDEMVFAWAEEAE